MIPETPLVDAAALLELCRRRGVRLATAEGCTGGLVAAALTAIPRSSEVLERGFVAYSYHAKIELLGVPAEVITTVGAVSEEVARRMAEGALLRSHADIAVSVTGVAGPGGGSPDKPVGLIWLGLARQGCPTVAERCLLPGDRTAIRIAAVMRVLALIRRRV